jgi:hypothetical protein
VTIERFLLAYFAVLAVLLVIWVVRNRVLPRRYGRHLIDEIARELGFARTRGAHGDTLLAGQVDGHEVAVSVSPVGYAVVTAPVSEQAVPHDLSIFETSSWSYQRYENRELGLTINTGDPEFDAWFDVHGDEPTAALRVPEHARRVLVAHRRRGLMIVTGTVMLGSGSAAPFGYVYQRPDTLTGVIEMVRAAAALVNDLEGAR